MSKPARSKASLRTIATADLTQVNGCGWLEDAGTWIQQTWDSWFPPPPKRKTTLPALRTRFFEE